MADNRDASESDPLPDNQTDDVPRTPDNTNFENSHPHTGDGASPGKIFIGGLARETTSEQFIKHFGKYGEITDSVIMKDKNTGQPRGFGFVTYADASAVDRVIEDTHIINGKQVEIKRTIPRGAHSKDFKTRKIFVGGIPTTVSEDEFRDFFSKFGEVKEQQIMRDHSSGRSRGFGFVTFESDKCVDDLIANGNRLDFAGTLVEIKKAEPKKPNFPPPAAPTRRQSSSRVAFGGGHRDTYGGYDGGFGSDSFGNSYRSSGAYGSRVGDYGGYGGPGFRGYSGYGGAGAGYGGFRMDSPLEYSNHFGGGYGRGYDVGSEYGGPGDRYAGYGGYGGTGYGGGYDAGFGDGYGGGGGAGAGAGAGGSLYGHRGGYGAGGGNGRYHPYGSLSTSNVSVEESETDSDEEDAIMEWLMDDSDERMMLAILKKQQCIAQSTSRSRRYVHRDRKGLPTRQ